MTVPILPSGEQTTHKIQSSTSSEPVLKPSMSDNEILLLQKYCSQSKSYFEYGMGGSTYFCRHIPSIIAIDSDKNWINKVQTYIPHGQFHHIDIGKVGAWGNPIQPFNITNWPSYPMAIQTYGNKNIDLVLIDGRFRVACALQVWLYDISSYVLIHDFEREGYQPVLEFYTILERIDNLVVLQKKKDTVNLLRIRVEEVYQQYKYIYQ